MKERQAGKNREKFYELFINAFAVLLKERSG